MVRHRQNDGPVQNGRLRTNISDENDRKGVISSEPVVVKTGLPNGQRPRDGRLTHPCFYLFFAVFSQHHF